MSIECQHVITQPISVNANRVYRYHPTRASGRVMGGLSRALVMRVTSLTFATTSRYNLQLGWVF